MPPCPPPTRPAALDELGVALGLRSKHGSAAHVEVAVVERDEHVDVRVSDDGSGFDPAAVEAGFGLIGCASAWRSWTERWT